LDAEKAHKDAETKADDLAKKVVDSEKKVLRAEKAQKDAETNAADLIRKVAGSEKKLRMSRMRRRMRRQRPPT